jgi:hypothetical protein
MNEVHLRETELARLSEESEEEVGVSVAEHLRWCARCRSGVADYRWLQGEIVAALSAAADAVAVPRSRWWAVQEALSAGQRRQAAGWRASAVASVVLAVCLMLSLSPILGTAAMAHAARTAVPEPVIAPAPVTAVVSGGHFSGECLASMATPTPVVSCGEATPLPTPALMLPPTPPEPGT